MSKKYNVVNVCNLKNDENLSRHCLLEWLRINLGANVLKIEHLCRGWQYCKLIDQLYPGVISMKRVKFDAKLEHDYINNFKVLQEMFMKLKIQRAVPVNLLVKGKFQDNLEFFQWFQKFYDANNNGNSSTLTSNVSPRAVKRLASQSMESLDSKGNKAQMIARSTNPGVSRLKSPKGEAKTTDNLGAFSENEAIVEKTMSEFPSLSILECIKNFESENIDDIEMPSFGNEIIAEYKIDEKVDIGDILPSTNSVTDNNISIPNLTLPLEFDPQVSCSGIDADLNINKTSPTPSSPRDSCLLAKHLQFRGTAPLKSSVNALKQSGSNLSLLENRINIKEKTDQQLYETPTTNSSEITAQYSTSVKQVECRNNPYYICNSEEEYPIKLTSISAFPIENPEKTDHDISRIENSVIVLQKPKLTYSNDYAAIETTEVKDKWNLDEGVSFDDRQKLEKNYRRVVRERDFFYDQLRRVELALELVPPNTDMTTLIQEILDILNLKIK